MRLRDVFFFKKRVSTRRHVQDVIDDVRLHVKFVRISRGNSAFDTRDPICASNICTSLTTYECGSGILHTTCSVQKRASRGVNNGEYDVRSFKYHPSDLRSCVFQWWQPCIIRIRLLQRGKTVKSRRAAWIAEIIFATAREVKNVNLMSLRLTSDVVNNIKTAFLSAQIKGVRRSEGTKIAAKLIIKHTVGKSTVTSGEGDGGINVTTYLGAFMDLETVVRLSIQGKKDSREENNWSSLNALKNLRHLTARENN